MHFRDFIHRDATIVPLASGDRDGAIRELVEALGQAGGLDASAVGPIVDALVARERAGTTGFGRGVAVPHAKDARVTRQVGAIGVSRAGIDFAALDRKPVFTVIVLLSPKGHDNDHVHAMETAFRSLNQEPFRRAMRDAATPADVLAMLDAADAEPPRPGAANPRATASSSAGSSARMPDAGDALARVF